MNEFVSTVTSSVLKDRNLSDGAHFADLTTSTYTITKWQMMRNKPSNVFPTQL